MKQIISIKNISAFTFIEVLVIISIITLMATFSIFTYKNTQKTSRDIKRKTDIKQLSVALGIYYNRFGKFPDEDAAGDCDSSKGVMSGPCPAPTSSDWGSSSDLQDLVSEKILTKLPYDPLNSGKYFYIFELDKATEGTPPCPGSGNQTCRFILQALLENNFRSDGQRGECVYTIIGGEGIPNGNVNPPTNCQGNIFPSAWGGTPCCIE